MKALFIDHSEEMQLGLVGEALEFDAYCLFDDRKNASKIHSRLHDLLCENKILLENIQTIFTISGPGSYTGMKIVEGIARLMAWQKRKIYSFYQFEIPQMVGIDKGCWISQAYKEEIFIHSWEGNQQTQRLIPKKKYVATGKEYSYRLTKDLLLKHTATIFAKVRERGKYLPAFYYRNVESEFTHEKLSS